MPGITFPDEILKLFWQFLSDFYMHLYIDQNANIKVESGDQPDLNLTISLLPSCIRLPGWDPGVCHVISKICSCALIKVT